METVADDLGCLSMFVDHGSVESHRLFLARRTALEMLRDRGYGIAATDIDLTVDAFRAAYGDNAELEKLNICAVLLKDPSQKILVVFCGTSPVKLATLRDISAHYGKDNLSRMILVLQSNMTSMSRDKMKDLFPFKVETFQITELLINVTKHELMPEHQVLSADEKQKHLQKYNILETQLPRMLETDAIAKYYGLEKGSVVKITYKGDLAKNHVTYRCIS